MSEDAIFNVFTKLGAKVTKGWYPVSERPGKEPFAKELEYSFGNFWGKVHLRNDGDLYIHVISKDVFNWKDKVKDLKLKGEIVDAAGGLMWIKEEDEKSLEEDLKYLSSYLSSVKTSSSH
ncbi:succinate dehydrogenase [Stygiolobus caldivivus]|uniref:Succinate dehydrogenase n=1 Tax=Stygiolobus caldivivus TaxID=2824673 RepID=A0A8D5U4A9_9CREN|nr:succinate dehydrogenase [Stygiolobus caldivivus]BCU68997.1 hypothetical protein KN1_02940 [Stygiolobus caldivivus]